MIVKKDVTKDEREYEITYAELIKKLSIPKDGRIRVWHPEDSFGTTQLETTKMTIYYTKEADNLKKEVKDK